MSLNEFKQLSDKAKINPYINERDLAMFYNMSMMTQVDELDSDRCYEMSFVEFLEGFARLAKAASLPGLYIDKSKLKKRESMIKRASQVSLGDSNSPKNNSGDNQLESEEILVVNNDCRNQPLSLKIEALIVWMIQHNIPSSSSYKNMKIDKSILTPEGMMPWDSDDED